MVATTADTSLVSVAKSVMRRLGHHFWELEKMIEDEVKRLPDDQLMAIFKLTETYNGRNCWYAEEDVAPHVRSAIRREMFRRHDVRSA